MSDDTTLNIRTRDNARPVHETLTPFPLCPKHKTMRLTSSPASAHS